MFTIDDTEEVVYEAGTVLDIELHRESGEGFGLNIVGGMDSKDVSTHSGIFISSINPGGPADQCGDLNVGDRLLQIKDLSLTEVTHEQAVDAFRNAGLVINLKVEKFGQRLLIGKISADMVDGPRSLSNTTTSLQHVKNFFNSWPGALIIGTVAGMAAMFGFNKLIRAPK